MVAYLIYELLQTIILTKLKEHIMTLCAHSNNATWKNAYPQLLNNLDILGYFYTPFYSRFATNGSEIDCFGISLDDDMTKHNRKEQEFFSWM